MGNLNILKAKAAVQAGVANEPMVVKAITTTVIGLANPASTAVSTDPGVYWIAVGHGVALPALGECRQTSGR